MERKVIRTVKYREFKYIAIMDESIAKLENASKLQRSSNNIYQVLCSHVRNNSELSFNKCALNPYSLINRKDVFYLPTVDEYIKLGIVLRRYRRRFNKKKNEIITL